VRRGLRYELTAEPLRVYVCHCRDCRKQSASVFGISVAIPPAALRLTRGEPRTWSRRADSGRSLDCVLCPACGSRVWHESASADTISVKGGSLDHPPDLTAAIHL
jgi:hypothetical protein